MIVVGLLIMSMLLQCSKKGMSPKDKAIWMAKNHVITFDGVGQVRVEAGIKKLISVEKEAIFPIGWEAAQVSESIYMVAFRFTEEGKNTGFYFHVVPKDDIVQWIQRGSDGLGFDTYLKNLKATSTYTDKKLSGILQNFFGE